LLRLLLPAVVVLLSFLAFLPALDAGFSWDDAHNLDENPHYRGLGWSQLRWMFTTTLMGHYIPLTCISLGLNHVLGGMSPWGYHLGNLLLHAANAGVFYFVGRRLLAAAFAPGMAEAAPPAGAPAGFDVSLSAGAALAALIFGVHPLRAESVAWVTERRDVLCGLFYLLATLAYLRGVARGGGLQARWRRLSIAAFVLALLSKAAAMPLPAVLLLLDIYPLGRVRTVGWRRLLVEKAPYLLLAGGAALVAAIAQSRAQALTGYQQYGAGARLGMTAYNLMFYPWKLVWSADLSPLYELPRTVDPLAWRFLFPTIAFVLVTVSLVSVRRRYPGALAAWVYSALLVLPVTGAVVHAGVQLAADRYSYLSGLGFALVGGGALTWVLRERERLKPSIVSACLLVTVLIVAGWTAGAWRQSKIWHDDETLWRRTVEVDPDCAVCSVNLGAELVSGQSKDLRRAREAEALFRHGLALDPRRVFAYRGLGVALALQRRNDEAEAAFRSYMARDPGAATGPADLGVLRLNQRRYAEAIPFLRQALAMDPLFPDIRAHLAKALRGHGDELRRQGDGAAADALLKEAENLASEASASRPARPARPWITTPR
jgi:protein O-mannosyl-transferase